MVKSDTKNPDFDEYWGRFAAYLKQSGRSPITVKNYLSDLKSFKEWLETSERVQLRLKEVSSKELQQYQEFLLMQQKLQSSSVNRRMGTLKKFYEWIEQNEPRPNCQLPRIPQPIQKNAVKRETPLSQTEQIRLLDAVKQEQNCRDIAIIMLLLHTGIRVGELCQLQWADLDVETEQGQMLIRHGKNKQDRRLMLSPDVCSALRNLRCQSHASSYVPVFIGQRGAMTTRGVQVIVSKYALKSGLKKLNPHMLRRTFISNLIEQKREPEEIAALTGVCAEMLLQDYMSTFSGKEASQYYADKNRPCTP